jgi:hypothetical protein
LFWTWLEVPVAIVIFLALGFAGTALSSLASLPYDAVTFGMIVLWFLVNSALWLYFPACPRCGLNAFLTIHDRRRFLGFGQYPGSRLQRHRYRPNRTCSRCDLDLTRYGIFDPRAKREA